MSEPHTELDPRFSEPDAEATSWRDTVAALESAELAWITTVRSDGRPHVTPLVAVWHDDALYFSTGPTEQKAVNLQHSADVIITTGCNDWEQGLDVVVEGTARRVTEPATLGQLATLWADKWDGRWRFHVDDHGFRHDGDGQGIAHVYRVQPAKILAFGRQPFTHTRHLPG
jgi:general stress protein 26